MAAVDEAVVEAGRRGAATLTWTGAVDGDWSNPGRWPPFLIRLHQRL